MPLLKSLLIFSRQWDYRLMNSYYKKKIDLFHSEKEVSELQRDVRRGQIQFSDVKM